jgi:hypothetical protein
MAAWEGPGRSLRPSDLEKHALPLDKIQLAQTLAERGEAGSGSPGWSCLRPDADPAELSAPVAP